MADVLVGAHTQRTMSDCLPHRHPMLLVDRILEAGPERAVGIKAVTSTEPWFTGHFPEHPVLPGVILLEAMAQVGRFLKPLDRQLVSSRLARIDSVRFHREAVPGDVVRMEATYEGEFGTISKYSVVATIDDAACAQAVFTATAVLA